MLDKKIGVIPWFAPLREFATGCIAPCWRLASLMMKSRGGADSPGCWLPA